MSAFCRSCPHVRSQSIVWRPDGQVLSRMRRCPQRSDVGGVEGRARCGRSSVSYSSEKAPPAREGRAVARACATTLRGVAARVWGGAPPGSCRPVIFRLPQPRIRGSRRRGAPTAQVTAQRQHWVRTRSSTAVRARRVTRVRRRVHGLARRRVRTVASVSGRVRGDIEYDLDDTPRESSRPLSQASVTSSEDPRSGRATIACGERATVTW
jgi:hypothetical protein